MKKIMSLCACFALFAGLFSACAPDDPSLGAPDVKPEDLVEGIGYTITYDATNPNIVYLTSLMDAKYTPQWQTPQGRSQKQTVMLEIPFPGDYPVTFGVDTRGGVVMASQPGTIKITDFEESYFSNDMWTDLTGGVWQSKTWYLDLDANAVSRYFLGPLYYFTATYDWDALHTPDGISYLDDGWNWQNAITPLADDTGAQLWYWLADYPGNSWECIPADFGTMTFDLDGGANVNIDQSAYGLGSYKGTYTLDVNAHTISFTDAQPLNLQERNSEVVAATEFRILYLTKDALEIMIVPSGTCLNYISEDYKNNWMPVAE